jgi:hypothetical protein
MPPSARLSRDAIVREARIMKHQLAPTALTPA